MNDAPNTNETQLQPAIPEPRSNRALYWGAVALLMCSCAYFVARGPWRALADPAGAKDLRIYYCASRAWTQGLNPYDQDTLEKISRETGGGQDRIAPPINLPPSLVPMSVVGCLGSWQTARAVWVTISVALTLACLWQLCVLLGLKWSSPGTVMFWAIALALAPFHTDIHEGQLSIMITTAVILALRCQIEKHPRMAGAMLGLAIALKPTLVILLPVMLLFRGQWRMLIYTIFTYAIMGGMAIGKMNMADIPWPPYLEDNLRKFANGGSGDPAGPTNYKMVNLHAVLSGMIQNPKTVWVLTGGLAALVGAAGLLAMRRLRDRRSELLLYSLAAVLCLVTFYNRIYGATLLVLPLAWAMASIGQKGLRGASWLIVLLILPFMVPGAVAMAEWFGPQRLLAMPGGPLLLYHQVFLLAMLAITIGCAAVKVQKVGRAT